jgi:putative oxidoreductase
MKIVKIIATYLLALPFLVFGLNFFLHFIPMPPMEGPAASYIGILVSSGFFAFLKVIEISLSLLLMVNFRRALALVLLAPISLNIFLFEIFIAGKPGIGLLLVILNLFLLITNYSKYKTFVTD